jgi:hypothetical protein
LADALGEVDDPGLHEQAVGHGVLAPGARDQALGEVDDELPVVVGLLAMGLADLEHFVQVEVMSRPVLTRARRSGTAGT